MCIFCCLFGFDFQIRLSIFMTSLLNSFVFIYDLVHHHSPVSESVATRLRLSGGAYYSYTGTVPWDGPPRDWPTLDWIFCGAAPMRNYIVPYVFYVCCLIFYPCHLPAELQTFYLNSSVIRARAYEVGWWFRGAITHQALFNGFPDQQPPIQRFGLNL